MPHLTLAKPLEYLFQTILRILNKLFLLLERLRETTLTVDVLAKPCHKTAAATNKRTATSVRSSDDIGTADPHLRSVALNASKEVGESLMEFLDECNGACAGLQ